MLCAPSISVPRSATWSRQDSSSTTPLDEDVEVLTTAFLNTATERRLLRPGQYVLVREVGPRRWFDIVDWYEDLDEALEHADARGQPAVFDCADGAEIPSAWGRVAG